MANKEFRISVENKIATLVNKNDFLVCGNNDYKVIFDFDEDWANHNVKTALFVFAHETVSVVFEGNECDGVAVYDTLGCYVGVIAGDIKTTTPAVIPCVASISDVGKTPAPPTEDVYNQIMALLNKYIEQGGSGGGYTKEEIEQIVADYLEENAPTAVSPTVKVTQITNGYNVTITDVNGAHSFDIFNGAKGDKGDKGDKGETGEQGIQGIQGEKGADGYTPQRGVDYWTSDDISTIESYIDSKLGDISTALDEIIALQDYYTGATFDELHEYATDVAEGGTT